VTTVPIHCPRCGRALSATLLHVMCQRALDLEPPRYCIMCGRRMKVQVVPTGWTAECVQHGIATGGNAPLPLRQDP
jgi:hypothetical protein